MSDILTILTDLGEKLHRCEFEKQRLILIGDNLYVEADIVKGIPFGESKRKIYISRDRKHIAHYAFRDGFYYMNMGMYGDLKTSYRSNPVCSSGMDALKLEEESFFNLIQILINLDIKLDHPVTYKKKFAYLNKSLQECSINVFLELDGMLVNMHDTINIVFDAVSVFSNIDKEQYEYEDSFFALNLDGCFYNCKPYKKSLQIKKYHKLSNNKKHENMHFEKMNKLPNGYYVYTHKIKESDVPFYVGKGLGKRAFLPKRNSAHNRVCDHNEWLVEILEENLTEEEALKKERMYIDFYSRNGVILTNII